MGDTELEHLTKTPGKTSDSKAGGAESGAVADVIDPIDPDLRQIIEAWPMLPDVLKAGIMAMVTTASGDRQEA